jgi:hypothetical protein
MQAMKRLRNSSGIPDVTINNIVSWIATELGIDQFDVEVRNCSGTLAGSAYTKRRSQLPRQPPTVRCVAGWH